MSILSNYEKIRKETFRYYSKINTIFSPAFNEKIFFNSEGFNHIIYKTSRREREKSSQLMRFKLLPLAVKLIEKSTTFQEYEEIIKEFDVKRHKKRVRVSKLVKYWGLIAIIESKKIKVIIRQVGEDGAMHFWSLIPAWSTNKYRDVKFVTNMKGNPEED